MLSSTRLTKTGFVRTICASPYTLAAREVRIENVEAPADGPHMTITQNTADERQGWVLMPWEVADFSALLAKGLAEYGVFGTMFGKTVLVTFEEDDVIRITGDDNGASGYGGPAILSLPLALAQQLSSELSHWVERNEWPHAPLPAATQTEPLATTLARRRR